MSRSYANYNQYLASQLCCNLNTGGPQGPQGATGPASNNFKTFLLYFIFIK